MARSLTIPLAVALGACLTLAAGSFRSAPALQGEPMQLGAFSVSLAVEDLAASKAFYETLGFATVGGNEEHNWLVLQNDTTTIGLFQGMFPSNILTFNPGWTHEKKVPEGGFQDVREIQARLKAAGLTLTTEADPDGTGPASLTLVDPDGNAILLDQHVPRAEK